MMRKPITCSKTFATEKKVKPSEKRGSYSRIGDKYKHDALKAAKELGYGDDVIAKIKACDNGNQISRIMLEARKEKWDA